jgi:hypothetical protein
MDKLRGSASALQETRVTDALAKLDSIKENENFLRQQFRYVTELLVREWSLAETYLLADLETAVSKWGRMHLESEKSIALDVWTSLKSSI